MQKVSQDKFIQCIDSMARGNAAAARVNVAHDAADKKIRIFAISHSEKKGKFTVSGYSVEVIYDVHIVNEANVGVVSYQYQHNCHVLDFAGVQFAFGKKAFGRKLVECLATAQPDLFWSSPTHPVMTVREILNGMKKDDETIKEFLKDVSETWASNK